MGDREAGSPGICKEGSQRLYITWGLKLSVPMAAPPLQGWKALCLLTQGKPSKQVEAL